MSAASLNAGARSLSISGGTHNHNKSIIRAALAITTLIIPFAILSIPALSIRNGLFPLQEHLMKHGPRYIPGSTPRPYNFGSEDSKNPTYPTSGDVVVEHFTGVEEVDRFLTIMNLFFGPAFRDHEVGVLCLHFFGGCMVFLGLLGVEAERSWTGWRRIFCYPAIWGMMGQLLSLGVTMPIYASLYLLAALTGPIPAIPVSATPRIKTLIPSILLGCVLPTLAMVLSYAFASTTTHQTLVAAWQIMPLYISFFQLLLPAILPFEGSSFTSITAGRDDLRKSLRTVYDRLRALQSTTHIASLFYTTRIILPHPSCDLANVLTPANPFVPKAIDSLNEGTLRFLQWDYVLAAASMAALVFGTTPKVKDGVRKFFMAVFEGVGTVLAVTALDREEVRWEAEDLKVAKKK